jgi:hypothetical protein
MPSYRVRQGCAVIGGDGVLYKGGSGLPETWPSRVYKDLLNEPVSMIEQATAETKDVTVIPPNAPTNPALPGKKSSDREGAITPKEAVSGVAQPSLPTTIIDNGPDAAVVTSTKITPPQGDPNTPISKWNLDPVLLETKSLDELNVMAIEIDAEIKPFGDKMEAVAFMSADYKGA